MPLFLCGDGQSCAQFSSIILLHRTTSYYKKELMHGELFPDSSIVIPFGCAALVLNKEDEEKFKGTCAMMVFVHYALDHPLYTYALFSSRTKKIIFRQDVIFLPNLFPMREARAKSGISPQGEALVAYRPFQAPRLESGDDVSFKDWKDADPLPQFQDHITGYPLLSPTEDKGFTSAGQLNSLRIHLLVRHRP